MYSSPIRASKKSFPHFLHSKPNNPYILFTWRSIQTNSSFSAASAHARLIKSGTTLDTYTWNNILTIYSRSISIDSAHKLFDEIPHRDIVSWNALIAGYVSESRYDQAWCLFRSMMRKRLAPNQYTFGSVLKSVASTNHLYLGHQLHSLAVKMALDQNVYVGSALVDMYAKCDMIDDAYMVLMLMLDPSTVSWNAVITGYAWMGEIDNAFQIFCRMEREGFRPDEATFASILTLVDAAPYLVLMSEVHGKIVKYGRAIDAIVYNAAITAYSQCGSIVDSIKIFEDIGVDRDLVTWNSMLAAYASHGLTEDAIKLFVKMQIVGCKQDMYTFTSVISSCFKNGYEGQGRMLHGLVIKKGLEFATPVSNALIAMYIRACNYSAMDDAMKCFDLMESRDSITWNSILTGFSQIGLGEEALKFFARMRSLFVKIDQYAFSATLRSCSDLAVLQLGQQIHGLVFKSGFGSNDFVASSVIYMYSKSGIIGNARRYFDETNKDNSVTWNSIIFAYAQHGQGQTSFSLFHEMLELGVEPDHITFVGLLSACSHIGLVEEGFGLLNSIESIYGVPLRMEHYACGVDLFGRAGQLDEAMKLVESMPFEPDAMVWMTLLGACRIHGNIEMVSHIANHLMASEPRLHSSYVLLSNMYAGIGMWDDRAMIQKMMRNRGVSKVPGWSWIEINNKVHSFNAEDRSHPQAKVIYERLESLVEEIEIEEHISIDAWMLDFEFS